MTTTRIHLLAKELGVKSTAIIEKCQAEGLDIKDHMSTISSGLAVTIRKWFSEDENVRKINPNVYSDDIKTLLKNLGCSSIQDIKKAAKQGDASAQYNLGMMYKTGLGMPKNHEEASKWISKAKKQISKKTNETIKRLKGVNNSLIRCKHCGDAITETCEKNGCNLKDVCLDCHNEIVHGTIKNSNIHIVGSCEKPGDNIEVWRDYSDGMGSKEDWSDCFDDMGSDFWDSHYSKFEREWEG